MDQNVDYSFAPQKEDTLLVMINKLHMKTQRQRHQQGVVSSLNSAISNYKECKCKTFLI